MFVFFGSKEADTEEDAREGLVGFLKNRACHGKFRPNRIPKGSSCWKRVSSDGKPRQIIARFLKYPQREEVMSNPGKLKRKNFEISLDLPSEILERRKKKMKQFKLTSIKGR